jgi:hypothetical protein
MAGGIELLYGQSRATIVHTSVDVNKLVMTINFD